MSGVHPIGEEALHLRTSSGLLASVWLRGCSHWPTSTPPPSWVAQAKTAVEQVLAGTARLLDDQPHREPGQGALWGVGDRLAPWAVVRIDSVHCSGWEWELVS